MTLAIQIILLALLISISGFFSAYETALFSLSSMKVRTFKQDPDKRKQLVAALLANPRELLVTIIMLNIIVSIFAQNIVSSIFGDYSGWALNVGVPLALMLIFGEVIPKSIGLANNAEIAYRVAPFLDRVQRFFYPVCKLVTRITSFVSRCLFFYLKNEKEISVEELQHALKASRQFGVLNEDEAELVRGYLKLQESSVKELMRPREEILYYDTDDPLSKLVHLFVDQECSRIPVCKEGLDNLIGIVSSQYFFLERDRLHTSNDVLRIIKKPFFAPETIPADVLLRQMYARKESLAIVVDEYGAVGGLIALEDLVEEVVGEIEDRRDEKKRYTRSGEDVLIASGKMELAELEEIFEIPLFSKSKMATVGGWLTEQLGDIPKSGTKYVTENFLFHVLAADPNRVRRIYIRRLKPVTTRKKRGS